MQDSRCFPLAGLVRLKQVIAPEGPIPISRSSIYARIKAGTFPRPIKLGRISAWKAEDIREFIDRANTHRP